MQSVLDQDYPNIELIVVDDGSTDNSHEVISNFAKRHPQVRIMLNDQNRGQSAVLNQALVQARGEFVQFLPSDDWYLPNKTRIQIEKFLSLPPNFGVVYGRGYRFFEDSGKMVDWAKTPMFRGDVLRPLIERGNFVYPVTPMFRRECFLREPFDETYRAEGEAIFPRLAKHYFFDYVDAHVGVMREHTYNIGKDAEVMYHEINRYLDRVFADPELPPDIKACESIVRARHYRTKGLQLIRGGRNRRLGRESLINAIAHSPRLAVDPKLLIGIAVSFVPEWRGQQKGATT
ncbi:MAG: hypothetical protein KatS3mg111_3075 [Pirellulaceae bacterium]|nr:MAG: hypothetical protein KatS3mg111_3075 [Pirellulaceae bacterium]